MLQRHYAPKTKTVLTADVLTELEKYSNKRVGVLMFDQGLSHPAIEKQLLLSENSDLKEAAANLYLFMHELDKEDLDVIIAQKLPDHHLGASINDRLGRATK